MKFFSDSSLSEIAKMFANQNMNRVGIVCIYILKYLEISEISIENYLSCIITRPLDTKQIISALDKDVFKIFGNDSLSPKSANYPNHYVQGFVACYYYKDDINMLMGYLNNKWQSKSKQAYTESINGALIFYREAYNIDKLHKYVNMISNDNINTDKHRWKIDYIDRISMYLLLNSGKKDIWEINQQDLNAILTNISQLEYKKDSLRSPIKALFNCSASDVLCWWRSAFLGQEENMLGDTRLTTPPRVEISSKSLLKTDSVEERLKFALSKLDNSENIQAQIINVYKKNYFKESYHGLVQVKISEFMKYYNFCKDESFDCTKTENIRKYIEGKCFGKSNNYRNKIVNALRGYFKEAISCGYYASNPVKYYLNVESTKYAIIPDDKVIPNHDMKRIFLILNQLTEFEALFIRLLYHTGLRIGEVLYLTVGCVVEITPNVITLAVAPFKQREKPMLVMIEDIEAFEVVKQLVALRSRYGRLPHYKTNQLGLWLLTRCDDDGRGIVHLNPKMANAIISKACVLAGVKNYTNHCFRHSFAHRKLNDEKYDLEDVSLLLGHSCIDTVKIYTKLTNEEKLIYFSRILARRNAVKKYSETYKELKVNFEKHEYRITTNDCHNRWHGKGFCSTKETEACPVRHLSCYTCFLYKPDIKKVGEMKCDYVANYQLLNQELNKEFPILKDVILFSNILSAISGHLATLGVKDEILLSDKPVLDLAEKYIKEMK